MISASHLKRDSREALVRWLRNRSSGGKTSHSGTFDRRFPILDCTPFPRFSIESRQSKSPIILAGNILQCFSVAGARPGLNRIRLQLAIYFCLHRGSLPDKTARGQPRFWARSVSKNSVKNYMSYKSRFEPDRIVRRRTRRHYCGLASRIAPERRGRVK